VDRRSEANNTVHRSTPLSQCTVVCILDAHSSAVAHTASALERGNARMCVPRAKLHKSPVLFGLAPAAKVGDERTRMEQGRSYGIFEGGTRRREEII
jgi:hypothetical protein